VSPDGAWIAYVSDETGRTEVYVAPFPGGGRRSAISTTGAYAPRWSRDGSELFYVSNDLQLWVAELEIGTEVFVRERTELFGVGAAFEESPDGVVASYDISPDGEEVLIIAEAGAGASAQSQRVIVLNVFEELQAAGRR
jgi:dipeptidyl aminopeptidase/acylaminoacyl peptidase